jgi:hypothetical protein
MDGSVQTSEVGPLEGGAGFSTFAYKGDRNKINGTLKAIDGSASVTKRLVKIMPDPGNIQPRIFADGSSDTTVVSDTNGGFRTFDNLREGNWIVMPLDSVTADGDSIWAFAEGYQQAEVLLKGTGNTASTGILRAYRMDTEINGIVANDRDKDLNTIDTGEALAGVTMNLYTSMVDPDSLVGTATTGSAGEYTFSPLRQGTYVVQRVDPSADVSVLRKVTKGDTAIVTTDAGANITVGTTSPNPLPRWSYTNGDVANATGLPYFTFLYNNGTVRGRVIETGDVSTPVAAITVSLYRCSTAVGVSALDFAPTPEGAVAAGPPLNPSCTGYASTTPTNVTTDADGYYSYSNLQEGIYEIRVNPGTAGYGTDDTGPVIFKLLGSSDIESFQDATDPTKNHEVS